MPPSDDPDHPSLASFPALAICIKLLLPPFVTEPNALVLNSVLCWPLTTVEVGLQKKEMVKQITDRFNWRVELV